MTRYLKGFFIIKILVVTVDIPVGGVVILLDFPLLMVSMLLLSGLKDTFDFYSHSASLLRSSFRLCIIGV